MKEKIEELKASVVATVNDTFKPLVARIEKVEFAQTAMAAAQETLADERIPEIRNRSHPHGSRDTHDEPEFVAAGVEVKFPFSKLTRTRAVASGRRSSPCRSPPRRT